MNWTLICVIAILLINILVGVRKGLIKMVFSMIAVAAVTAVTVFASPHIAGYLAEHTSWETKVYNNTYKYLEEHDMLLDGSGLMDVDKLPLPKSLKQNIADKADELVSQGADAYNSYVTGRIADIIFTAAVYVACFIIVSIIVFIIGILLNVASRLPVLKQINRISGGVIGLAVGVIFVWLGFVVITFLGNTSFAPTVFRQIDENAFLTFMYDRNIILNVLIGIF
ncbi:MAG: CvpA family protein [Lachnospiraceae bacterium]|nr:CvpA family protein [Lachnospiraceae bacterium]